VVYYREQVFAKDGCKSKARYGTWFYAKYNKKSSGQVSGTYRLRVSGVMADCFVVTV